MIITSAFDLELHQDFKVKFWNNNILGMGGPVDMKRRIMNLSILILWTMNNIFQKYIRLIPVTYYGLVMR